jgi:hypothetical protein
MIAISPEQLELDPISIDPRHCGLCGRTIDQHRMVDIGEGPEFFCEDLEIQIHLAAADLVRQWELAGPRGRRRHTGEAPLPESVRNADIAAKPNAPRSYRTPQATVDAFMFVVRLDDQDYLARWLAAHKRDAAHLLKIWKAKQC